MVARDCGWRAGKPAEGEWTTGRGVGSGQLGSEEPAPPGTFRAGPLTNLVLEQLQLLEETGHYHETDQGRLLLESHRRRAQTRRR